MSNRNKAKWLRLAKVQDSLESSQSMRIIAKVFSKLIPNKDKCLQIISMNNFCYPSYHCFTIQRECLDILLISNAEYLIHQSKKCLTFIVPEVFNNLINTFTTKQFFIATFYIDPKALLILIIREIFDDTILQRIWTSILYTSILQCLFYAFLHSKKQVVIAIDI